MTNRQLQPHCVSCGAPVPTGGAERGVRCPDCFATYLRGIDAAFLDNLSRFGIRSRQVVAETCLRALVLANADDRKLLGMTVYEQFVGAASDLIGLHIALRRRASAPIAESFLAFTLDAPTTRAFFAELAALGPAAMLEAVGLPHPAALPKLPAPGMGKKERRELEKALHYAVQDFDKLTGYQELGERALAIAADHLRGMTMLTDRTGWLAGRAISPGQVASVALDGQGGRLDIAALRVDEERLEQVVNGIDIFTRLARNLIHSFLTLHEPDQFESGFGAWPSPPARKERGA
jgi:hypothetical protein